MGFREIVPHVQRMENGVGALHEEAPGMLAGVHAIGIIAGQNERRPALVLLADKLGKRVAGFLESHIDDIDLCRPLASGRHRCRPPHPVPGSAGLPRHLRQPRHPGRPHGADALQHPSPLRRAPAQVAGSRRALGRTSGKRPGRPDGRIAGHGTDFGQAGAAPGGAPGRLARRVAHPGHHARAWGIPGDPGRLLHSCRLGARTARRQWPADRPPGPSPGGRAGVGRLRVAGEARLDLDAVDIVGGGRPDRAAAAPAARGRAACRRAAGSPAAGHPDGTPRGASSGQRSREPVRDPGRRRRKLPGRHRLSSGP